MANIRETMVQYPGEGIARSLNSILSDRLEIFGRRLAGRETGATQKHIGIRESFTQRTQGERDHGT